MRSRLDYGAVVYQSATPSALKMFDPVHNLGIRLATGAFRTSPVESLCVEANEWPLILQRTFLSLTYFLRINANTEHPSYKTINDTTCSTLYHNRPSLREPFSLRVRRACDEMDVPLLEHHLMAPAKPHPPWLWQTIDCDVSFMQITKHAPETHILMHFRELQFRYSCQEFYTDASKSQAGVSYAALGANFNETNLLHSETTIFTAEAYAILSAVNHIRTTAIHKAIIFTDSLSVVKALRSFHTKKNPIISELYSALCTAYVSHQHITICWVPAHRGIYGNMLADETAGATVAAGNNSSIVVPAGDLKHFVRRKLCSYWQRLWDLQRHNKLHVIKPKLDYWPPVSKVRRTEVIFCRLRIGHTYATHGYILIDGEPPVCAKCGRPLTVLHVLLECHHLEEYRRKHFPLPRRQHLPLHPAMFLGNDPFFNHEAVLKFLEDVQFPHVIYQGEP